jgi:hypothetical protein
LAPVQYIRGFNIPGCTSFPGTAILNPCWQQWVCNYGANQGLLLFTTGYPTGPLSLFETPPTNVWANPNCTCGTPFNNAQLIFIGDYDLFNLTGTYFSTDGSCGLKPSNTLGYLSPPTCPGV